jgi:hypothetical protein
MASIVKVKNSVTAGARPAAGTGTPGELFVNVADLVIGTFDAAGAPVELGAPNGNVLVWGGTTNELVWGI